jgi:hypothetical protein
VSVSTIVAVGVTIARPGRTGGVRAALVMAVRPHLRV